MFFDVISMSIKLYETVIPILKAMNMDFLVN